MDELQRIAVFWVLNVIAAGVVLTLVRRERSIATIAGYCTFLAIIGLFTAFVVSLGLLAIGADGRLTDWISPALNGIALWLLLRFQDRRTQS